MTIDLQGKTAIVTGGSLCIGRAIALDLAANCADVAINYRKHADEANAVVAEMAHRVNVMYAGRVVEEADVRTIYKTPKHPYTIGLLSSTLDLGRDRRMPLQAIPGLPPTLIDLPAGCPFWPRCPRQTECCQTQAPALEAAGAGHEAACWHLDGAR